MSAVITKIEGPSKARVQAVRDFHMERAARAEGTFYELSIALLSDGVLIKGLGDLTPPQAKALSKGLAHALERATLLAEGQDPRAIDRKQTVITDIKRGRESE